MAELQNNKCKKLVIVIVIHLLLRSRAGDDIVFVLCRKNQHRSSLSTFTDFSKDHISCSGYH